MRSDCGGSDPAFDRDIVSQMMAHLPDRPLVAQSGRSVNLRCLPSAAPRPVSTDCCNKNHHKQTCEHRRVLTISGLERRYRR
jgi:hypothetical protein